MILRYQGNSTYGCIKPKEFICRIMKKKNKMKTLYISIPISGHPIVDVKVRAYELKEMLSVEGWEVITPFDVVPDEDVSHIDNSEEKYAYCMGKDIEKLLLCDAVFFANGYVLSKGCMLEKHAAELFNKIKLYELTGINYCIEVLNKFVK